MNSVQRQLFSISKNYGFFIFLLFTQEVFACSYTLAGGSTAWTGGQASSHSSDDVCVNSGSTLTIAQGSYSFSSLTIGGTVILQSNTSSGAGTAITANSITVSSGGSLSGDGQGYLGAAIGGTAGAGPAAGGVNTGSGYGFPGGHGGTGGNIVAGSVPAAYDSSTQPVQAGSSGGSTTGSAGGNGGGAMKFIVSGTFTVTGNLSANGLAASSGWAGAGAGGSIWIQAGTWAGSGILSAAGASGAAGDGGGGRIALYYTTSTYTGTYSVNQGLQSDGGTQAVTGSLWVQDISASATSGNIYCYAPSASMNLSDTLPVYGLAINAISVDKGCKYILNLANTTQSIPGGINVGATTASSTLTLNNATTISSGSDMVVTSSGSALYINNVTTLNVTGNLTLGNSTTAIFNSSAASPTTINVSGNVSVGSLATMNVDGLGSAGAAIGGTAGAGTGAGGANTGSGYGYGASHGGTGGNIISGAVPAAYGNSLQPFTVGSGGGSTTGTAGGNGGGAMKFVVGGTFTLSGNLSANGLAAPTNGWGGAGSGGSIWIQTATWAGAGTLSATGSSGAAGDSGGGRIAVYFSSTNTYTGNYNVNPGTQSDGGTQPTAGSLIVQDISAASTAGNIYCTAPAAAVNFADTAPSYFLALNSIIVDKACKYIVNFGNSTQSLPGGISVGSSTASTLTLNNASTITSGSSVTTGTVSSGIYINNISTLNITGNLALASSSTMALNSSAASSTGVNVTGNVTVGASASLNADGFGYAGGIIGGNSGSGPGGGVGSSGYGYGASHGGTGGSIYPASVIPAAAYGSSTQPITVGSGGGSVTGYAGGNGGGAMKFIVNGTFTNNGTVSANGITPSNGWAGGGAGGSVWIQTGTWSGSGQVNTIGGNGAAGNAGGGRVAIYYTTSTFAGVYAVNQGTQSNSGTLATPGSFILQDISTATSTSGEIYCVTYPTAAYVNLTNGLPAYSPALPMVGAIFVDSGCTYTVTTPSTFTSSSLTVGSTTSAAAKLNFIGLQTYTVNGNVSFSGSTVTVNSGSTSVGTTISVSGDLSFTSATMNADGFGYAGGSLGSGGTAGSGPGGGGANVNYGGGGGHGGVGQTKSSGGTGGVSYGSSSAPIESGSGGGGTTSYAGSAGGGALKLIVAGTTTIDLNSTLSANGIANSSSGGGGAGGSLWLQSGTLAGSGSLSAAGGNSSSGGCGGGGRMILTASTNTFTGTKSVAGGCTYTNSSGSTKASFNGTFFRTY